MLKLPENVTEEVSEYYRSIIEQLRVTHERSRGAILSPTGFTLWEEPLDEYNKRMEELDSGLRV